MSEQETAANELVKHYSKWAIGAGCIPIPLVDLAGVTGVQVQMLSKMSDLYGVPFSENRVKSIIAALIGGLIPAKYGWTTGYIVGSAVKSFPVVGALLGIGTVGAFAGATTYAVGKVFVRHFETGGNLLTFDTEKAKEYFQEQYEKGAETVKGTKGSRKASEKDGAEAATA